MSDEPSGASNTAGQELGGATEQQMDTQGAAGARLGCAEPRRRRRPACNPGLPIIFEGNENMEGGSEQADFSEGPRWANLSEEQIVALICDAGPFAAAVASGVGPPNSLPKVQRDRHDEKIAKETDAILQSLSASLNLLN